MVDLDSIRECSIIRPYISIAIHKYVSLHKHLNNHLNYTCHRVSMYIALKQAHSQSCGSYSAHKIPFL